ncbi:MBOAT family O-acyltransferase [Butyrivibrio sp. XPD2006]|uniref:MBOAT family O-acyltransferase n=1 Tax=Butyrivibrio sp. XPD2006 TaxID=1280668 RepID=UPI0018CA3A12|nr:MBOAT family O-acyltransferase [Butyrivibrio sp. XPD2006]
MANSDSKYRDACKWLIVVASLVFYAPFGVRNLLVLVGSIVVNAVLAKVRVSQWAAVIINLVALLFFKFNGVFFPIAVSFYTFNQISYQVDLNRGEIKEFKLADYLAYILFFPKLLQGPLMGYGEFTKCIENAIGITGEQHDGNVKKNSCSVDWEMIMRALFLLSMGLFKKVILADTFGQAVNFGYENVAGLGSLEAILVAVFYSFQLYFDFSGYCDMASAVCMMMGFELPMNFNSPYKAVNIIDFWKRWHITLTKFFTKYVYIPLGGNRKGTARLYLNLMIVFLLSGLWHGNGLNFIVWGAMHGVLYVITRAVTGDKAKRQSSILKPFKVLFTFIYVTLAWVFFRAATISDAITLIMRMFIGGHRRINTHLSSCFQLDEIWYVIKVTPIMKLNFAWDICLWLFIIVSVVMIFFMQNAYTIAGKAKIGVRTTIVTAVLLVWCILSFAGVSTFLYMNF